MNKPIILTLLATLITLSAQNCPAHFGMLIPERIVITQAKKNIGQS